MKNKPMLDDVKHYAKYAGLWLTARGIVSLAILAATVGFGVSGYAIPLITLPIGLGVAAYLTHDRSNYLKTRMKNAYKLELAATLGKNPKEVTVEDLMRVAEGDKNSGLPGNAILKEQMERIDKEHTLSIMSTAAAVGVAAIAFFAIIGGGFTSIIDWVQDSFQSLIDILPVKDPTIFAAGILASGISFTSGHSFQYLGEQTLGLNERTTYEMLQDLKRQRREGVEISPEQVLGIFVSRNPLLHQHIMASYGVPYSALSPPLQTEVLNGLDQRSLIVNVTEKINAGKVSPNELAFLTQAQHSGLPERDVRMRRHIPPSLPGIARAALKPATMRVAETISNVAETISNIAANLDHSETPPQTSFVERYLQSVRNPRTAAEGFAGQVRRETGQGTLPIERR